MFIIDPKQYLHCLIDMSFKLFNDIIHSGDKQRQVTASMYAADQLLMQWRSNPDVWKQLSQPIFKKSNPLELNELNVEISDNTTLEQQNNSQINRIHGVNQNALHTRIALTNSSAAEATQNRRIDGDRDEISSNLERSRHDHFRDTDVIKGKSQGLTTNQQIASIETKQLTNDQNPKQQLLPKVDQSASLIVADGSCPEIRELLIGCERPVLWMDGSQHPFSAITQALAIRRQQGNPVETLHWISHGSAGQLHVAHHTITSQSLIDRHQQLAQWGLQKLVLWSCSTGAESSFISLLEEFTAAKVWSSRHSLGRLRDGSAHWQLTSRDDAPSPQLPIDAQQLLSLSLIHI